MVGWGLERNKRQSSGINVAKRTGSKKETGPVFFHEGAEELD